MRTDINSPHHVQYFFYYAGFHETRHRPIDFCGHLLQRILNKRGEKCRNTGQVTLTPVRKNSFQCTYFHKARNVQWGYAEIFCFKFHLRQSINFENMRVNSFTPFGKVRVSLSQFSRN
jgi:hypothetical protein